MMIENEQHMSGVERRVRKKKLFNSRAEKVKRKQSSSTLSSNLIILLHSCLYCLIIQSTCFLLFPQSRLLNRKKIIEISCVENEE